ncbi:MAG: 2-hydroxyacid dehydrogenase [Nevskiales bacterium]|nr:2-hydroxyacid dehydrogenase [Nevskiales bacterium]
MKTAIFNTKPYERAAFETALRTTAQPPELDYLEPHLTPVTAPLAQGYRAVCAFVNDDLGADTLRILAAGGTELIALRSAGFNHVDIAAAADLGLTVARVPAYSPHAVAEHTVGLILTLNRKIHRAYQRVREGNFALGGLMGFDLHGKTAGIVGTGKIGTVVARILRGFGMRLLAHDVAENPDCVALGAEYRTLPELLAESDVVTLHCPLTPDTRHLIDAAAIAQMKPGAMLINTSRGALVDTRAVTAGLKSGRIGHLGLDVYEEEGDLFFEDLSDHVIQDDVFMRLLTFPNVLITAHQAFFTHEALGNIVATTLANIAQYQAEGRCDNAVTLQHHSGKAGARSR